MAFSAEVSVYYYDQLRSHAFLNRIPIQQLICNSIAAVLLSRRFKSIGRVLFWEALKTDRFWKYEINPKERDAITEIELDADTLQMLTEICDEFAISRSDVVHIGVATYVHGLKLSAECQLRWRLNENRFLMPEKEFGTHITAVYPFTRALGRR